MNKILLILLIFLSLTITGELGYYYYLQKYYVKKQVVAAKNPDTVLTNSHAVGTPSPAKVHTVSYNTNYYQGRIVDMDVDGRVLEWDFDYKLRFKLQSGNEVKPLFISKYVMPNMTINKIVDGKSVATTLSDIYLGDEILVVTKADNFNANYATNLVDVQITKKSSSPSGQLSSKVQPAEVVPLKYLSQQTVFETKPKEGAVSTWTAHADSKGIYTFKYPANIDVIDGNDTVLRYQGTKQQPGDPTDGWMLTFSKPISLSESGFSDINGYIQKDITKAVDSDATITKETTETIINGLKAYMYTSMGKGVTRHIYIQSPNNKDIYVEIGSLIVDPKNNAYVNIVDSTLATFSFLH